MADSYELDKEISLDFKLDDIPDLPGYVTFPTGAFLVVLEKGIEERVIERDGEETKYFSIEGTLKEILDLEDKNLNEGEEPPKPGDVQSFLFKRNHALAMGNFKEMVTPIAKALNLSTVGEVIEASKGLELIWVGVRKGKKKDGEMQYNFQVKKSALAT